MSYHYQLLSTMTKTCYVLHQDDKPVGPPLEQVAICFDAENGALLKHGSLESVTAWYDKTTSKLRISGATGEWMAESLRVVCGPFPVEELNRALDTSGYCLRLMQKVGVTEGARRID